MPEYLVEQTYKIWINKSKEYATNSYIWNIKKNKQPVVVCYKKYEAKPNSFIFILSETRGNDARDFSIPHHIPKYGTRFCHHYGCVSVCVFCLAHLRLEIILALINIKLYYLNDFMNRYTATVY